MSKGDKVYAVIFNGCASEYGCELYCAGVFSTIEKAKRKAQEVAAFENVNCRIIEFEVDGHIPVKQEKWFGLASECYLGGYVE